VCRVNDCGACYRCFAKSKLAPPMTVSNRPIRSRLWRAEIITTEPITACLNASISRDVLIDMLHVIWCRPRYLAQGILSYQTKSHLRSSGKLDFHTSSCADTHIIIMEGSIMGEHEIKTGHKNLVPPSSVRETT